MLTWDSDLLDKDKALRIAYVGTKNYDIGVNLAKLVAEDQAEGRHDLHPVRRCRGGQPQRAHAGHPRHARRAPRAPRPPGDRLTGQNGWTEVDGCPLYTDDDFPRSVQQMEDILGKYPKLDAFMPTGGFPQFIPQAYAKVAEKHKARIDSGELALVVADTLPVQMDLMKKGLSLGPGRPAAVRDGLRDHGLPVRDRDREEEPGRPDLHRPRRLHARRPPTPASAADSRQRSTCDASGAFPGGVLHQEAPA